MGWTYLPCNSTGQRTGAAQRENCIYGKLVAAVCLRFPVNCNGSLCSVSRATFGLGRGNFIKWTVKAPARSLGGISIPIEFGKSSEKHRAKVS
jgi:hypothetical protein